MEKEIIIDGVKVEECSYYNKDNTPYCCEVWDNECEAQNCYYKQLKRLEQENERLQEEIKEYKKHSRCAWKSFENTLCEEGEKYKTCLQEIKTIAEENKDTVQYGGICKSILMIITKAEEE